jgi:hypothetical protein
MRDGGRFRSGIGRRSFAALAVRDTRPFAKNAKERGTHCVADAGEIKSMGHPPIEGKVAENGTLDATVKITARGDAELPLRQAFLSLAGSVRQWGVQGAVMGIGRSDKITDIEISDPTATGEPFILSFHLTKPIFVRVWEKESSANLPLSACRLDALGGYPIRWDNGDSSPLRLGPPRQCTYRVTIAFPQRIEAAPPTAVSLQSDFASYKASYKLEGHLLTASRTLTTYMDELPSSLTESYEAFRQQGAQVLTDSGVVITVVSSGPPSQK